MPAFTTAALVLGGLAVAGYGAYEQQQGLSQQQQALALMRQQQTAAAGDMNKAQTDEINQEQAINVAQKQQMDLQYKRSQIQTLRDWQKASAMSLATVTGQGVGGLVNSSALAGARAGESGQANTALTANRQNYDIGTNIYNLNTQISADRIAYANAQTAYGIAGVTGQTNAAIAGSQAAMGSGLMSLGGSMISNAGTLGNVASSVNSQFGRSMSFGTGPGAWMS